MLWRVGDNPCVAPQTVSVRPVEDSDRDWLRETLAQSGHLRIFSRGRLTEDASRLAGFRQLRSLNLYHTFVTPKGYEQVHAAVPACEIIWDPRSSDPKRSHSRPPCSSASQASSMSSERVV